MVFVKSYLQQTPLIKERCAILLLNIYKINNKQQILANLPNFCNCSAWSFLNNTKMNYVNQADIYFFKYKRTQHYTKFLYYRKKFAKYLWFKIFIGLFKKAHININRVFKYQNYWHVIKKPCYLRRSTRHAMSVKILSNAAPPWEQVVKKSTTNLSIKLLVTRYLVLIWVTRCSLRRQSIDRVSILQALWNSLTFPWLFLALTCYSF